MQRNCQGGLAPPDRGHRSHDLSLAFGRAWLGLLAGVGFTVALFITQLAFTDPTLIDQGKIGILVASFAAGVLGWLFLRISTKETEETWETPPG